MYPVRAADDPALYPFQTTQRAAAAAGTGQNRRIIPSTVAHQRHGFPRKRRQHDFSFLSWRYGPPTHNINALQKNIRFADVHAVVRAAFHRTPVSAFSQPVMIKHFTGPGLLKLLP